MATRILSSLSRGVGRFTDSAGRILTAYKPIGLALGAMAATYSLTSAYLFEVSNGQGSSMEPTIPNVMNKLGVNKRYRNGKGIQVGDCVQIASPLHPNVYAGKRVVGLPGDYVLRSKANSPTPGGAPVPGVTDWKKRFAIDQLQENGTNVASIPADEDDEEWDEPEMIQVPEGHVWLEGDNLAWSRDSRVYGAVPMALIKGRSSWYCDGLFSWVSLRPGKGLRKVQEWEMDAVLGEDEEEDVRSMRKG